MLRGRVFSRIQRPVPGITSLYRLNQSPLQCQNRCFSSIPKRRRSLNPEGNIVRQKRPRVFRELSYLSSIPAPLLPPAIFIGLLVTLWTWKCFWIIVMQNKLLYLTWLPPFTRSDTISEYESQCKPVEWKEMQIRSSDGTKLAVCEGSIPAVRHKPQGHVQKEKLVMILYFQGNGGSTPLRLPMLSQFLKSLPMERSFEGATKTGVETRYVLLALSYRGYWKSSGRATQSGIERDAQAFLTWTSETYSTNTDCEIILWGHSLGSAVAGSALSTYLARSEAESLGETDLAPVSGLVMEAPISNIKDMLIGIYPQKWLPYRYLWPFSWNTWCSAHAFEQLASWRDRDTRIHGNSAMVSPLVPKRSVPPVLILAAEDDEIIPPHVAGELEQKGHDLGLDVTRINVPGAMHTECTVKNVGKEGLVNFVTRQHR